MFKIAQASRDFQFEYGPLALSRGDFSSAFESKDLPVGRLSHANERMYLKSCLGFLPDFPVRQAEPRVVWTPE